MNLYEIGQEYIDFMNAVETGEIPEEAIADTLEGIKGEFEQKADNIACMIKELNSRAVAIKEETTRLAERQSANLRRAEGMKRYLSESMQRAGLKKMETARNALNFRKSTSVYIADEEDFKQRHAEFCKREVKISISRKEVGDRLKAGEEISGAELRENQNLQIK